MNRVDAWADVTLLPSDRGGRSGPTPPTVFGCILVIDDVNLDVRLDLPVGERLAPGDTTRVGLRFLDRDFALRHVHAGARFRLRETRVIGEGEINAIGEAK